MLNKSTRKKSFPLLKFKIRVRNGADYKGKQISTAPNQINTLYYKIPRKGFSI